MKETHVVDVKREGRWLTIRMPLRKAKRSKSGKTIVVASTFGPLLSGAKFGRYNVAVVANAFYDPKLPEWRARARVAKLRADRRLA